MRPDDDSLTGLDHAHRGSKPGGGAIYHMKVRTASRSKGQSARAAAAYIERSDEYGRDPDSAAELVYTESGHMPGWADADAGAGAYWDMPGWADADAGAGAYWGGGRSVRAQQRAAV